jgi:hypothetical protein
VNTLAQQHLWLTTNGTNDQLQAASSALDGWRNILEQLQQFIIEVSTVWAERGNRRIGEIALAPPIGLGVGINQFTEDWAIIKIDSSIINASNFTGNTLNLDGKAELMDWMRKGGSPLTPLDGILHLEGTIPIEEIRSPNIGFDVDDHFIRVLKHGRGSKLTVGRGSPICSYTRHYFDDHPDNISKEWSILPSAAGVAAFSVNGDSGAAVIDGRGRIGGLLTGGSQEDGVEAHDITYATPATFILERMKKQGLVRPNLVAHYRHRGFFYTLRWTARTLALVLFSPIWLPFYVIYTALWALTFLVVVLVLLLLQ